SDKLEVIRARTIDAAAKIADESLDWIYIDGDHTLRGITIDLLALYDKVKPGGFIGGDDFHATAQHSTDFEPTLVCPFAVYFAEAKGLPFRALGHGQFVIDKDPGKGFSFNDDDGRFGNLSLRRDDSTMKFIRRKLGGLKRALRG
ncbi:MAG: class I SAM-dependent methyltransferase, partial [Planctomycetota bacterium]